MYLDSNCPISVKISIKIDCSRNATPLNKTITIIYYFKVIRIIFADRIEKRIIASDTKGSRNSGIVEKKNNRMDRKIDAGKMRGKFVGSNEKASDFVCDPRIGRKRKSKA